jgi:hypothetical protein
MCEPYEFTTSGDDLFAKYKNFCAESLFKALGKSRFYKRLDALTHSRKEYGNTVFFQLKLKES